MQLLLTQVSHSMLRLDTQLLLMEKLVLRVRGGSPTEPKVEVAAKGTINYKRMVKAVIVCSVTEKFFESGVETSVHIGSPVKADISLSSGQVHVSMKNPEEPLYNRKQTIVEVDVQPYTHSGPIAKQASKVEEEINQIFQGREKDQDSNWKTSWP